MSHMKGVKGVILLIPKFVQCVISDGSYDSCDLLTHLWQRSQWRQDKHFVIYAALQEDVAWS